MVTWSWSWSWSWWTWWTWHWWWPICGHKRSATQRLKGWASILEAYLPSLGPADLARSSMLSTITHGHADPCWSLLIRPRQSFIKGFQLQRALLGRLNPAMFVVHVELPRGSWYGYYKQAGLDKDKHCPPVQHFDESTKNKFREKGYSPPAQQRAWLVFFELKLDCTWLRKALTLALRGGSADIQLSIKRFYESCFCSSVYHCCTKRAIFSLT